GGGQRWELRHGVRRIESIIPMVGSNTCLVNWPNSWSLKCLTFSRIQENVGRERRKPAWAPLYPVNQRKDSLMTCRRPTISVRMEVLGRLARANSDPDAPDSLEFTPASLRTLARDSFLEGLTELLAAQAER